MSLRLSVLPPGYLGGEDKESRGGSVFTPLQESLFPIFNEYVDLLYLTRSTKNAEQIRSLYMLHALNHTLKYVLNGFESGFSYSFPST